MKVVLTPSGNFKSSKHRNSGKGMSFVDTAGKAIKGNSNAHWKNVYDLQEARFNKKLAEFETLSKEELKEKATTFKGSSTDQLALQQAYYNKTFVTYKDQSLVDLESITGLSYDNLDEIEKQCLSQAIELKKKKEQLEEKTN